MKLCPRCKALAFDDMSTCYNCLYPFNLPRVEDALLDAEVYEPDEAVPVVASATTPAALLLDVRQGLGQRAREVLISEGQCLQLGRAHGSDVVLIASNVSRHHAMLRLSGGELVAEDLGSTNGTFVNGCRVQGHAKLTPGDVLGVGEARLSVGKVGGL